MIHIVQGDLLQAEENIIVHQTNTSGGFGSGIAKQIRNTYPEVYHQYMQYASDRKIRKNDLLGTSQIVTVDDEKFIANLFGQMNYGYDGQRYTNYEAFYNALSEIKRKAKKRGYSVALPKRIGSDLAGGSWSVVYAMIDDIFEDYEVTIYELV